MASERLLRGFTALQPIKLELCETECGSIALPSATGEDPVMDSLPVSPRDRAILTVRTLVIAILQTTADQTGTAKQLYTYFYEVRYCI